MLVPTFLQVSGTAEYCLTDLSVTGYPAPTPHPFLPIYEGGCPGGTFIVRQLTKGGKYDPNEYYWIDDGINKGWFADALGAEIPGGAANVKLPADSGLWIYGSDLKLVGSGAVNFEEVRFTTVSGGSSAVGNGNPVDLKLSDLSVTGYPDPTPHPFLPIYEGGCPGGTFIVRQLTKGGKYEASEYYWIDDGINKGWYADALGTPIEGGAAGVTVEAGKGLWVYGSALTIIIPGTNVETK